jgi:molecular chaperone Hsp33
MLCDINSEGGVRVKWIPANLEEGSNQNLTGVLVTIKHNRERELYRGVTEINDESITSALAHHLNQSSQIDCLLRTSIQFKQGRLEKAIGILLEKYPESEENPSATKEEFLSDYDSLNTMSESDFQLQVSKNTMCGHPLFSLESKDLHWFCSCSDERIDTMLTSIGKEELLVILEEMPAIETRCEYCNTLYHRDLSDVDRLFPTA